MSEQAGPLRIVTDGNPPSDGDIPVFDGSSGVWRPGTPAGGGGGDGSVGVAAIGTWHWDDALIEVIPAGGDTPTVIPWSIVDGVPTTGTVDIGQNTCNWRDASQFAYYMIAVPFDCTVADFETRLRAALAIGAPALDPDADLHVSVTGTDWPTGTISASINGTNYGESVENNTMDNGATVNAPNDNIGSAGAAAIDGVLCNGSPVPDGAVMTDYYFDCIEDFESVGGGVNITLALYAGTEAGGPALSGAPANVGTDPDTMFQLQAVAVGGEFEGGLITAQAQDMPLVPSLGGGTLTAGAVEIVAAYFIPETPVTTTTPDWSNVGD